MLQNLFPDACNLLMGESMRIEALSGLKGLFSAKAI